MTDLKRGSGLWPWPQRELKFLTNFAIKNGGKFSKKTSWHSYDFQWSKWPWIYPWPWLWSLYEGQEDFFLKCTPLFNSKIG